jgi:dihydroorotate dehydrogenase (NAD+) catalytic subunit
VSARLAVKLAGIPLQGPLVLASGVLGVSASSMAFAVRYGANAVTTKSCSLLPRAGHPPPIVAPFAHGLLNAVGLSNPGAEAMAREIEDFKARCPGIPIFASVFGADPGAFAEAARVVAGSAPALIEVNISCPNVASEFGEPFSARPEAAAAVTRAVRDAVPHLPISVKLSLHCPSLAAMARACEAAGADALTAINTVGPGMILDPRMRRPILSNRTGGLSGGAILPLAVRAVWDLHESVGLPILGTGGVEDAEGALQLIEAGATAVGIGTAVWTKGAGVFREIEVGLGAFLDEQGVGALCLLRGVAHG